MTFLKTERCKITVALATLLLLMGLACVGGLRAQLKKDEVDFEYIATVTAQEGFDCCLWNMASKYYGDPYQWPIIKDMNNIPNERRIAKGTVVYIPKLPVEKKEAGKEEAPCVEEVVKLKKMLEECQAKNKELTKMGSPEALKMCEDECNDLRMALKECNHEREKLAMDVEELEHEMKYKCKDKDRTIEELEDKLHRLERERDRAREELDQEHKGHREARRHVEELEDELRECRHEIEELEDYRRGRDPRKRKMYDDDDDEYYDYDEDDERMIHEKDMDHKRPRKPCDPKSPRSMIAAVAIALVGSIIWIASD